MESKSTFPVTPDRKKGEGGGGDAQRFGGGTHCAPIASYQTFPNASRKDGIEDEEPHGIHPIKRVCNTLRTGWRENQRNINMQRKVVLGYPPGISMLSRHRVGVVGGGTGK